MNIGIENRQHGLTEKDTIISGQETNPQSRPTPEFPSPDDLRRLDEAGVNPDTIMEMALRHVDHLNQQQQQKQAVSQSGPDKQTRPEQRQLADRPAAEFQKGLKGGLPEGLEFKSGEKDALIVGPIGTKVNPDEDIFARLKYSIRTDGTPLAEMISVPPSMRRRGIGTYLVKKLVEISGRRDLELGVMTGDGIQLRNYLLKAGIIDEPVRKNAGNLVDPGTKVKWTDAQGNTRRGRYDGRAADGGHWVTENGRWSKVSDGSVMTQ